MGVYLIHLDSPMPQGDDPRTGKPRNAQHYIGYSEDVWSRIEAHQKGQGARMLQVAKERGITFTAVRIWPHAPRSFERQLKNQHNAPRLCPRCSIRKEGNHETQDQNP